MRDMRARRTFDESNEQNLLATLGPCRNARLEAQQRSDYYSHVYNRVDRLMAAIDDVAKTLDPV